MTLTVKWHGAKAKADARRGAARGLYLGAEELLGEANRIVPIEEGFLLMSGVAHEPGQMGLGDLEAAVTYEQKYAVRQHEELTWKHDVDRHAKYLETPLNSLSFKQALKTLIAREVKRELG